MVGDGVQVLLDRAFAARVLAQDAQARPDFMADHTAPTSPTRPAPIPA